MTVEDPSEGALSAEHERPIRILLADDHTMFREGLAIVLAGRRGMEVVGQAQNDEGAVELARETRPDAVVMQVQIPLRRAKESLRRMAEVSPPPKVIIVTMLEEPGYIGELLKMGASAYLVKSDSAEHLIAAIHSAVLDGNSRNVVVGMPREMLEVEGDADGVLSTRELEILLLAARGLSNHQIAAALHLSGATVKRHLANVYPKMGVASRGEAARKALLKGWITIREITEDDQN